MAAPGGGNTPAAATGSQGHGIAPSPPYRGAVLLALGFRPFFLLAGIAAVVGLVLWLADLAAQPIIGSAFTPVSWHAHEMLFGFASAVIAGFLLTAVPNWTGRPPLRGAPLLALALLWVAGRLVCATSEFIGAGLAAAVDLAFLTALLAVTGREIVIAGSHRNLPVIVALLVLLAANALMHMEVLGVAELDGVGWRMAIAAVSALITLIGGRIVPNFTRNWLVQRGASELPAAADAFDSITVASTAVALAVWTGLPGSAGAAILLGAAALLNAGRLCRWQGHRTWPEPLVLFLHVGYAWIALGLALLALAQGVVPVLPDASAAHGLTVGALGTMTLAVMTRATLGHTGRALAADRMTVLSYALVTVAGLTRIGASLWPEGWTPLLWGAGVAWVIAFAGFVVRYGPMLITRRTDGKPG